MYRIEMIAKQSPKGIVLREKDLSVKDYNNLAEKVMGICDENKVVCILHSFTEVAISLNSKAIHLPLTIMKQMSEKDKQKFSIIGVSCHSIEDAKCAENLGCTYITAGHIFYTDCKKGIQPRGLKFLRDVCNSVSVPVYAIGGINRENYGTVYRAGAKGICLMSGFMRCKDVQKYMEDFVDGVS